MRIAVRNSELDLVTDSNNEKITYEFTLRITNENTENLCANVEAELVRGIPQDNTIGFGASIAGEYQFAEGTL
jgi:hypothetical protein